MCLLLGSFIISHTGLLAPLSGEHAVISIPVEFPALFTVLINSLILWFVAFVFGLAADVIEEDSQIAIISWMFAAFASVAVICQGMIFMNL